MNSITGYVAQIILYVLIKYEWFISYYDKGFNEMGYVFGGW